MADYLVTDTELTSIADAIRAKGGTSDALSFPTEFVSAVNDIPSGGGSSYTLLASQEFSVTTTTTSETLIDSIALPLSAWTADKILYVRVRDKAGIRFGYFWQSNVYFYNQWPVTRPSEYTHQAEHMGNCIAYGVDADEPYYLVYNGSSANYGVYASSFYKPTMDSCVVTISMRYNASRSLTIDGTYIAEVFSLEPPDGISPF